MKEKRRRKLQLKLQKKKDLMKRKGFYPMRDVRAWNLSLQP